MLHLRDHGTDAQRHHLAQDLHALAEQHAQEESVLADFYRTLAHLLEGHDAQQQIANLPPALRDVILDVLHDAP